MRTRFSVSLMLGIALGVSTLVAVSSTPAQAANYTMKVISPTPGRIGVDAIYDGAGGGGNYDIVTCTYDPNVPTLGWNAAGNLEGTTSVPGSPTTLRFEMYPAPCDGVYDGWGNVGGVHIQIDPRVVQGDLGTVVMPVAGQGGAFPIQGAILSSTPIGERRVVIDTFQIPTAYPEWPAPLQSNGRVEYGAFASTANRGAKWTGGVGWSGRYIMFVTDNATGRKIQATVDITPSSIPTIDLDAICFGFDTCRYETGGPGVAAGSFHPTTPTRVLDTRTSLGIASPVRSGDGRHPSPDPITRRDETANHDLQITGRFGIPASGVSAVLLNVTAVSAGAPGPGYMSVVPKPARVGDIFNDQGTYGEFPGTSNLNFDNGDATPNLVLARIGAGGKIRIANYLGPTDVIADVAGWFGTGGAYTDGAGFAGVVPERLLDTRVGIGGPAAQFAAGETRSLQVAGVAGIPSGAQSVVVNITMLGSSRPGYLTAYPTGEPLPYASNVNVAAGGVRANTAVVKVGAGGRIDLFVAETNADVIVDVLGSFGDYGGKVTTITPERLVDSRVGLGTPAQPFGDNEARTVQIAGRGSVPAERHCGHRQRDGDEHHDVGLPDSLADRGCTTCVVEPQLPAGTDGPEPRDDQAGLRWGLGDRNGRGSANVLVDVMGYVS